MVYSGIGDYVGVAGPEQLARSVPHPNDQQLEQQPLGLSAGTPASMIQQVFPLWHALVSLHLAPNRW